VISQIHGANRLGGNSLLDTVVFGKIVGREAAKFAKKEGNEICKERSLVLLADVNNPTEFKAFIVNEPLKFRSEIQVMTENAGIIREVTKLQTGLKKILKLKDEFYSKESIIEEFKIDDDNCEKIVLTWQVKSSLIVCEAIISALMRQESRGAHYRSDFPKLDDEKWKVNIYCRKERKNMLLFIKNVNEIKGPVAELLKAHVKPEHKHEFE
jgi:succinate dehydrogenase/fumarate reductase flavoprotein subunit